MLNRIDSVFAFFSCGSRVVALFHLDGTLRLWSMFVGTQEASCLESLTLRNTICRISYIQSHNLQDTTCLCLAVAQGDRMTVFPL